MSAMTYEILIPDGEPFPGETLRADGWEYRDLPRMTPNAFKMLTDIFGDENLRWLTRAFYEDGSTRGQVFISPAGMERAKVHNAEYRATKSGTHGT